MSDEKTLEDETTFEFSDEIEIWYPDAWGTDLPYPLPDPCMVTCGANTIRPVYIGTPKTADDHVQAIFEALPTIIIEPNPFQTLILEQALLSSKHMVAVPAPPPLEESIAQALKLGAGILAVLGGSADSALTLSEQADDAPKEEI